MPSPVTASSVTAIIQVPANTPTRLAPSKPAHGFQVSIGPNSNPFNECWIEDDTAAVGMPDAQVGVPIGNGYSGNNVQIGLNAVYQRRPDTNPPALSMPSATTTLTSKLKRGDQTPRVDVS
jgi:hypothetical protein